MKKIINWTFGSVFRTFGRIIAYLCIGLLISYFVSKNDLKIPDFLGIMRVNASEIVTTNLNKFYVHFCDSSGENCYWSNSSDMGTAISTPQGETTEGFRARFGNANKFLKGVKYRVKVNIGYGILSETSSCDSYHKIDSVVCAGSLTSTWESNQDLIESCQFVSKSCYTAGGQTRAHYYFDVVTNSDVYGFQVNGYFGRYIYPLFYTQSVTVFNSSNVQYDRDAQSAIESGTSTIINNQNQNTQEIINNQNNNTQQQIESQKVCQDYDLNSIEKNNYLLHNTAEEASINWGITNYINIYKGKITVLQENTNSYASYCFYNINKTILQCNYLDSFTNNLTIPTNAYYIRVSIDKRVSKPVFNVCTNGNQALNESIHGLGDGIHDLEKAQEVCDLQDINNKTTKGQDDSKLSSTGQVSNSPTYFITRYIEINNDTVIKHRRNATNYMCFYDNTYTVISCYNENQGSSVTFPLDVTIPTNAKYVRFTVTKTQPNSIFDLYSCKNGNQALNESIYGVGQGIHDLQDSIDNSDTSESSSAFMDFLNNFSETDFGLASIITMPLTFISNLTSYSCNEIELPIPYLENKYIYLPCMRPIYEQYFGGFITLYDIIVFGIVAYKILIDIFRMLHNFRNPDNNQIEVLDL